MIILLHCFFIVVGTFFLDHAIRSAGLYKPIFEGESYVFSWGALLLVIGIGLICWLTLKLFPFR